MWLSALGEHADFLLDFVAGQPDFQIRPGATICPEMQPTLVNTIAISYPATFSMLYTFCLSNEPVATARGESSMCLDCS